MSMSSERSEEIRYKLTGPCPSIRTPFTEKDEIDYDSLGNELDFVISGGARNVIVTYGDSLITLLSDVEVEQVTKFVVEHVRKRALVVATTGKWNTPKTEEFAKFCAEVGVDVLMVLAADWGGSGSIDTYVSHYALAAKHIPLMFITAFGPPTPLVEKLMERLYHEVPGVVAVKDDTLGPAGVFARKLCVMASERWSIMSGAWKDNHLMMHPYGANGFLSFFSCFRPDITMKYFHAIKAGDIAAAVDVITRYDMPMRDYVVGHPLGFDAAIHAILEQFGIIKRYRRKPYVDLSDSDMEELKGFLTKLELL